MLEILSVEGSAHGFTLLELLRAKRVGKHLSPATLYPELLSLEDRGLIVGATSADGRRYYSLTADGAKVGAAWHNEHPRQVTAGSPRGGVTLGQMADEFAARLVGRDRRLDEEDAAYIYEVLVDTATEIEQALAATEGD